MILLEFRQHAYSRSYEVESFERLFALVNNAFIQYLSGVYLGSSHETFLLYLVDRAKLVNIRVGTAEIEHSEEYAAAEFFASSMKPRHLWGWLSATPLSLFKSTAFRDCVKVLTASVGGNRAGINKRCNLKHQTTWHINTIASVQFQ